MRLCFFKQRKVHLVLTLSSSHPSLICYLPTWLLFRSYNTILRYVKNYWFAYTNTKGLQKSFGLLCRKSKGLQRLLCKKFSLMLWFNNLGLPVLFLTCSVPDLKLNFLFILCLNCFGGIFDSHCGLEILAELSLCKP